MRFVLLSDLHLTLDAPIARTDDFVKTQFEKLHFVLTWAREHHCIILQAGDFFNRPRSWFLLPKIIDILRHYELEIYLVAGQHDSYMHSMEAMDTTSLGILRKAGLVHLLNANPVIMKKPGQTHSNKLIHIYGASWGESIPEVIDNEAMNILVVHKSISTCELWLGHKYDPASQFLMKHKDFDLILCGDIHKKFIVESKSYSRIICNTGTLLRLDATEESMNHHPGFLVYNSCDKTLGWIKVPHEENVLSRKHIEDRQNTNEMLDQFIEAIDSRGFEGGTSFLDNLNDFMKKNEIQDGVKNIISNIMAEADKE